MGPNLDKSWNLLHFGSKFFWGDNFLMILHVFFLEFQKQIQLIEECITFAQFPQFAGKDNQKHQTNSIAFLPC